MVDVRVERAVRRLARDKGLEPALLLAVVQVECPRPPFEADGVTPRFLFERHKFYQFLDGDERKEAIAKDLAIPRWSRTTQYKDQGTSKGRQSVLARAVEINMEAAYKSCSWGFGQIMGFNAEMLGYGTATQMFSELRTGGVAAQAVCFWRFIEKKPGLIDALKAQNWAKVALLYNGEAYAQNDYDTRLEAAYREWSDRDAGVDPENDSEVPLGRTPVQNAEPTSAWKTPEGVATGVSAGTGVAAAIKGATDEKGNGPIEYAFAFVIVVAAVVAAWFFIKRLRRNPE